MNITVNFLFSFLCFPCQPAESVKNIKENQKIEQTLELIFNTSRIHITYPIERGRKAGGKQAEGKEPDNERMRISVFLFALPDHFSHDGK